MTQQRVSNERRRELEQMDPFQEKLVLALNFVNAHKKQVVIGITAVLSVIIIFSGIMYSLKKSEDTAALMVSNAAAEYAKNENPEAGYEAVKSSFETIFKEYANTSAGKQANVMYAKICYDASKYDQSLKHYKEALDLFKNKAMMKNFLLSSLGHVSVALEDYEAAKKYFEQVSKSDNLLLRDEADFSLAMLYEIENKNEQSKALYEKIVSDHADSLYIPIAKSKLSQVK